MIALWDDLTQLQKAKDLDFIVIDVLDFQNEGTLEHVVQALPSDMGSVGITYVEIISAGFTSLRFPFILCEGFVCMVGADTLLYMCGFHIAFIY